MSALADYGSPTYPVRGYCPPIMNGRIMRRVEVTAQASAPSALWVPVRDDEPLTGLEICRAAGWRVPFSPTGLPSWRYWCWRWRGSHDRDGYPRIKMEGVNFAVHRLWAHICYGTLTKKEDAHHVCRHKWCVNPAHIEPMPRGRHWKLHGYSRAKDEEAA